MGQVYEYPHRVTGLLWEERREQSDFRHQKGGSHLCQTESKLHSELIEAAPKITQFWLSHRKNLQGLILLISSKPALPPNSTCFSSSYSPHLLGWKRFQRNDPLCEKYLKIKYIFLLSFLLQIKHYLHCYLQAYCLEALKGSGYLLSPHFCLLETQNLGTIRIIASTHYLVGFTWSTRPMSQVFINWSGKCPG